jgi:endonuclease-3
VPFDPSPNAKHRARVILGRLNEVSKGWPPTSPEPYRGRPFEVLVVCVLSTRTREGATSAAARRLLQVAPTPFELAKVSVWSVEAAIAGVAYPHVKAGQLVRLAGQLVRRGGEVPREFAGLCALPGVGPKVARITLEVGFGIESGVAVDTHVARVSRRLGLVDASEATAISDQLERILPRSSWGLWNRRLVQFGRTICLPRAPRCDACVLADICPSARY